MKNLLLIVFLIMPKLATSQKQFVLKETGITPDQITSQIGDFSKTALLLKTQDWLNENYQNSETLVENEDIIFIDVKENFIKIKKNYYHVKYKAKISFDRYSLTIVPLEVFTKINSKYDMGWKSIHIKNGSSLFKKKKVLKKFARYICITKLRRAIETFIKLS